jgi:hypothetical protein
VQHKRHFHIDAVFFDPGALDVLERLIGPLNALIDGVFKALLGSRIDFNDLSD